MLMSITYWGENSSDLGYLLYKNPGRPQKFVLNFGTAYVFYPEICDDHTTCALYVDVDPLDLAKGKKDSGEAGLFDYVNDRPYAASSFLSTAIVHVFGTAMTGRCDSRQELADRALDLSAQIYALPCRGDKELINRIFEPLGYTVSYQPDMVNLHFPEWGESEHVNVTIRGTVKLKDLLNHLYVLIPVFDRQKHYYINYEEIDKLMKHGEWWLKDHPEKNLIAKRYFTGFNGFSRTAIDRLSEEYEDVDEERSERSPGLNVFRMEAVKTEIMNSGAASICDLGCGEGRLISMLLSEQQVHKVLGMDVSVQALEKAAKRMKLDRMPSALKDKLELIQGSLVYSDKRITGYDCACLVEVIEHIDPARLSSLEENVFRTPQYRTIIVTTPNREYNSVYTWMKENEYRHIDHRFEWSREEFRDWCSRMCSTYGYTVEIKGIGESDETAGQPTQMGVFTKCV